MRLILIMLFISSSLFGQFGSGGLFGVSSQGSGSDIVSPQLLDYYSGASAAYSLRLIDRDWKDSSCVRVRRSSDNNEQNIGWLYYNSGDTLNAIIDTNTLKSFAGSDSAFVVTWYDQSGSGNHATQSTASSQPLIVDSGSVVYDNEKVAIEFDGVDDELVSTSLSVDFSNSTLISVHNLPLDTRGTILGANSTVVYEDFAFARWDFNYLRLFEGTSPTFLSSFNDRSGQNLAFFASNNSGSFLFVDGSADGTNPGSQLSANITDLTISSDNYNSYSGIMQNLIIYNSDQSSNREAIETNINNFYEIY